MLCLCTTRRAQPSNEEGWAAVTGVLFQGDTTTASLFKAVLLSTPATGGVSASARPLKRERCSKRDPTRADDAAPRDDDDESDHRRLAKSKDFMVLHINVFDDKDTFINRQYYELKNANCNPGTFFKPKMALLASSKNPPALLAADYYICTPSQSAAVQIALGAAMGTAGLVGSVVLAFMVAVSVFLSKKCSKEKMIMFDDGDIEDELYELAYAKLLEQKKIDDAAKEAEKKQKEHMFLDRISRKKRKEKKRLDEERGGAEQATSSTHDTGRRKQAASKFRPFG